MESEVPKETPILTHDTATYDKHIIPDVTGQCKSAIRVGIKIPDHLNLRMIFPLAGNIGYYDTKVLARHSRLFEIVNHLEREDRKLSDRLNGIRNPDDGESVDDDRKHAKYSDLEIKKVNDLVHRCGRVLDGYKYVIYPHSLHLVRDQVLVNILDWCYYQDDSLLDVRIENITDYLKIHKAFMMNERFLHLIGRKISKIDLDKERYDVDHMTNLFHTLVGTENILKICAISLEEMHEPGFAVLLLPFHMAVSDEYGEHCNYVLMTGKAKEMMRKYGRERIRECMGKLPKSSAWYDDVMEIANAIYGLDQ
ncbi:hypothetical protein HDU85_005909 [Gaertneriomyces sp. JEL0708]|nr:hypothetical protein HDU85_005909 [Gaertneriomyces sp. JEL0708]